MKFGNPFFLYGLFALAIPIIIHLFNFRRYKTVIFSDIRFLKEVTEQSQSKNKLKHYLILLSRLLFILFLVLTFAQPYLPNKTNVNPNGSLVSVFIDNSFSMTNEGSRGQLLEAAKKSAIEISKAFQESDRFQVLTNDFEGKHQRIYTRDEFIQLVEEIKESPIQRDINEVIARQKNALFTFDKQQKKNQISYIISDFQKSFLSNSLNANDSTLKINLIPLKTENLRNIYIDSVWFEQAVLKPKENNLLFVKIKNLGKEPIEGKSINLIINNKSSSLATFNIDANNETVITIPVKNETAGVINGELSLDDYPVTYDDRFYFSFTLFDKLNVSIINGKEANRDLEKLFLNDSFFNLTIYDENQLKISDLNNAQFIILNEVRNYSAGFIQELKRLTEEGAGLAIFPPYSASVEALSGINQLGLPLLAKADTGNFILEKPDLKNPFFNSVFDIKKIKKDEKMDLPKISYKYSLATSNNAQLRILNFVNGEPFLSQYAPGKGKIYLFSSPLGLKQTNFSRHALFVPIMYKMALNSLPENKLYYTLGKNENRKVNLLDKELGNEKIVRLKNPNQTIIPQQKNISNQTIISINSDQIKQPGNYVVEDSQNNALDGLSVNYNRNESDLSFYTPEELEKKTQATGLSVNLINAQNTDFTHIVKAESIGKKYWKLCLTIAILALLIESLLIRFYK